MVFVVDEKLWYGGELIGLFVCSTVFVVDENLWHGGVGKGKSERQECAGHLLFACWGGDQKNLFGS